MFTSNVTGGFFWHWQAWRSQANWRPTVEVLEAWLQLQTKNKSSDSLVIIGASAGWMMPTNWLCQFKEVHTFDIDPLAAPLFRWRHGQHLRNKGTALTCHTQNALSDLPRLLSDYSQACIFFDNVLGQLRFTESEVQSAEKNISQIVKCLKGREWGSVHDRMSGPVRKNLKLGSVTHATNGTQGTQVLWPETSGHLDNSDEAQQWLSRLTAQSPWLDHLTGNVFNKTTAVHNLAWAFKPNYWHWLQAGWVKP
jgi:hypothetical protein